VFDVNIVEAGASSKSSARITQVTSSRCTSSIQVWSGKRHHCARDASIELAFRARDVGLEFETLIVPHDRSSGRLLQSFAHVRQGSLLGGRALQNL